MPILGIENRTENWRTAQVFAPLFEHAALRRRFAERLGASIGGGDDVSLELFWHGLHDYGIRRGWKTPDYAEPCAEAYERLFPELRGQVEASGLFPKLAARHYGASDKVKLADNLRNTESDIVLEAPNHLFIGEAKREEKFGDDASVLKHQLVRQYAMARIVLDLAGSEKAIVPFVVGNDRDKLEKDKQVRFMIERLGMRRENVLAWADVQQLTG